MRSNTCSQAAEWVVQHGSPSDRVQLGAPPFSSRHWRYNSSPGIVSLVQAKHGQKAPNEVQNGISDMTHTAQNGKHPEPRRTHTSRIPAPKAYSQARAMPLPAVFDLDGTLVGQRAGYPCRARPADGPPRPFRLHPAEVVGAGPAMASGRWLNGRSPPRSPRSFDAAALEGLQPLHRPRGRGDGAVHQHPRSVAPAGRLGGARGLHQQARIREGAA